MILHHANKSGRAIATFQDDNLEERIADFHVILRQYGATDLYRLRGVPEQWAHAGEPVLVGYHFDFAARRVEHTTWR